MELGMKNFTSLEICAGAGGQALGLEGAGFQHVGAIEYDHHACATLRRNRDHDGLEITERWNVIEADLHDINGKEFAGIDLLAGGVPCPPFSVAGKQLGREDERDLFPKALEIVKDSDPKAVMLENVRGLSQPRFATYREWIQSTLRDLGYSSMWQLVYASEHGLPQLRPRFVLLAVKNEYQTHLKWPDPVEGGPPTVGEVLYPMMAVDGWPGADRWAASANGIGPTLVGGSKKHGGPDVGPTRAKKAWLELGVRGTSIANEPPAADFPVDEHPRLTVAMGAALQGFPKDWKFEGGKTAAWRQVGNAFPPPVAEAMGRSLISALNKSGANRPGAQPVLA